MTYLSQRINSLEESATLAMSRKCRELEEQGFSIINLSLGEPDFATPEVIREAAKDAVDGGYTFYPPIAGYADLRKAICEKFKRENNLDYTPEQIVVSTGAKQSIANLVLSLVDPGDEVIVPKPYWVSYSQIIQLAGGIPVYIETGVDQDFKPLPEQIKQVITEKTKVLVFSSPCNPTGSMYSNAELEAIAKVLEPHPNVFIISDEIYEHIHFESKHESIAQFDFIKDRVAIVNGVSKGYAMTGWRIGYIAAPAALAKGCDKIQGQFTSGASSIAQRAALKAVSSDWEQFDFMRISFRQRRDLILELMQDIPGLKMNKPQGAFYVFPDVSSYFGKKSGDTVIKSATDLCMFLLNEGKVALVTGEAFGDDRCIRISYATGEDKIREAVKRIRETLARLN